jgi:hypothetical protein
MEHIRTIHSKDIASKSLENFASICCRYTAPLLNRCPVCSTSEDNWNMRKKGDLEFEHGVRSFLEHIGSCMHDFSLRILPDSDPIKHDGSGQSLNSVSFIQDRSWPSEYLHVSHHTDAGLTEIFLHQFPERTRRDRVADYERTQDWAESAENMNNPNSPGEPRSLSPANEYGTLDTILSTYPESHKLAMGNTELRLLAIDGGGVYGLSALIILEQLMETVDPGAPPKPCDYFDMIGGTSTGG